MSAPSSSKCQVTADPSLTSAPAAGGSGTLTITTTRDCTWDASSAASWIAFTTQASGQGSGQVDYRVAANTTPAARNGTLSVNGTQLTIAQAGIACTFSVTPSSISADASGSTVSVQVQTSAGCTWTSTSPAGWVHVPTTPGSGPGSASVRIDSNAGDARSATVTIAGQPVRVDQGAPGAPPPPACTFTVSPAQVQIPAAGGTGSIALGASDTSCAWTAAFNVGWASVTGSTSGKGSWDVTYSVTANASQTGRTGILTVGGQSVTFTQAGSGPPPPACTYTVAPTQVSSPAEGGPGTLSVTTNLNTCEWTAASNVTWASITSGVSGTGNGTVSYSVSPNSAPSPRSGTFTVAGQSIAVSQAPLACSYSISPTSASVGSGTTNLNVKVTATGGCSWTAVSNDSWLTVTAGASGTGNGQVTVAVAKNSRGAPQRVGTVTIAGQTYTVTQAAG